MTQVRAIDTKRSTLGKESLLPLLSAEKKLYVQSLHQVKLTSRESNVGACI